MVSKNLVHILSESMFGTLLAIKLTVVTPTCTLFRTKILRLSCQTVWLVHGGMIENQVQSMISGQFCSFSNF